MWGSARVELDIPSSGESWELQVSKELHSIQFLETGSQRAYSCKGTQLETTFEIEIILDTVSEIHNL
jgi:hypothetical protein